MNPADLERSRFEVWRRTCVAGLRFIDCATSQSAHDRFGTGENERQSSRSPDTMAQGLEVNAILRREPKLVSRAQANPSGMFAFHGLPGMREFENDDPWEPPQNLPQRQFTFEVTDHAKPQRFLPLQFTALVPPKGRGLLRPETPDSPAFLPGDSLPLFSSVSRPVPAGFGHFCVELSFRLPAETPKPIPAEWALLQLTALEKNGNESNQFEAWAMADEKGKANVVFPWPATRPGGKNTKANAPWSFRLRAYFDLPEKLDDWKPEKIPSLKTILQQSPVKLDIAASDSRVTTNATKFVSLEMPAHQTEAEVLVPTTFDDNGRLPLRRLVIRKA